MYMGLRKLKIGTYVQASPSIADSITEERPPYWPIATVTMDTPVFDVVHMFSERGISAVPILDAEGVVMNLYESVDIIVSVATLSLVKVLNGEVDACPAWALSCTRPDRRPGAAEPLV
jgi:hypothetical protein